MSTPRSLTILVALLLSVAVAATGAVLLGISLEPNTDYLPPEPWLVDLGGGRFGVEFLTYGRSASAVRYGVVDREGNWISGPRAITPAFGYYSYPIAAYTVSDSAGNAYVAWNHYDRGVEAFHYIGLDDGVSVLAAAGPIGASTVQRSDCCVYPQTPGVQLSGDEVHIYWTSNGTRMKVVLDRTGRILLPASATTPGDNGTGLPARQRLSEDFANYPASVVHDSTGTYYLWIRSFYSGSPRSPTTEYELKFRRVQAGATENVLYSTHDVWQLSKPTAVLGIALLAGGSVGSVTMAVIFAQRVREGRRKTPDQA